MKRKDWKIDRPMSHLRKAWAQLMYQPNKLVRYCQFYLPPDLASQVETAARSFDKTAKILEAEIKRRGLSNYSCLINKGLVMLVGRERNWHYQCKRCRHKFTGTHSYQTGADTRELRYMVASKRWRKPGVQPKTAPWCETCARAAGLVW